MSQMELLGGCRALNPESVSISNESGNPFPSSDIISESGEFCFVGSAMSRQFDKSPDQEHVATPRVSSIFLASQVPDSTKPKAKWLSVVLEYRTGCNGGLETATDAEV